jgi:hypothetical protein
MLKSLSRDLHDLVSTQELRQEREFKMIAVEKMKKLFRMSMLGSRKAGWLLILLSYLADLSGCATAKLTNCRPPNPGYHQALFDEYQELAGYFWVDRWRSDAAIWFRDKAVAVSKSRDSELANITPDVPSKWGIEGSSEKTLLSWRRCLCGVLAKKQLQTSEPEALAHAQGRYDCWISEQGTRGTSDVASLCETDFRNSLRYLEKVTGTGSQKTCKPDVDFRSAEEPVPSSSEWFSCAD